MYRNHAWSRAKIDSLGTLVNILVIPGGFYFFFFEAARRLDGDGDRSFFFCLIPVWIAIVPFMAYFVLNGIASQNTRIRTYEKVILSISVPLGFLCTLIGLVWYIESYERL